MPDPIDSMAPWTIKSVSTATRDAIIKAARQEGLTVGQWLERRVTEWVESGSPVRQSYPVSDWVSLAQAVAALASAPDMPVVKTARIRLRAVMLALGQPMSATGSAPLLSRPEPTAPPGPG